MPESLNTGDTAWMLTSTALVVFMTLPGLALFYGGMVRHKNVLSTLMQSLAIACMASVLWVALGYSLAFAPGNGFVGGFGHAMLLGLRPDTLHGSIPEALFVAFQMTFAVITPALIAGAYAERMKFGATLLFSALWLLFVYAPVCHQVWAGDGFLAGDGVLDYAGGTVVHVNAGVAGLVCAWFLGKRKDFGTWKVAPHNLALTFVGTGMLWVGWFGFNAGSALAANGSAAMAMLVTHIAASAAAMTWLLVEWRVHGKPTMLGMATGAVAGLVAITPAAGFVNPVGALAIGLLGGASCFLGATALKRRLGVDDALDCFGVHGVGGLVGAVLTGVFAVEEIGGTAGGLEGNWSQVGVQLWGILTTVAQAGLGTWLILKVVDATVGLRVDAETEHTGLDLAVHGESLHGPSPLPGLSAMGG
jgi:Amt family ammonium transporter